MNRYNVRGHEVISFQNKEEVEKCIDQIDIIRVVNEAYNVDENNNIFKLENGETIIIHDSVYDSLTLFKSEQGNVYKPVVNENEDDDSEPIEYIGFQLI